VILGDIPNMGKARFIRARGSIKEVEFEEGDLRDVADTSST